MPHPKTEKRRQEIIGVAAAHLVEHGLQRSGLRAIAKSAGMSDRMIMYYFETKDDLVAEALTVISDHLANGMEQSLPNKKVTAQQLLDALLDQEQSDEVLAILRLFFEIIGLAVRGTEPYKTTAAEILKRSEERIQARLRADQQHRAHDVLARLEGELMLRLLTE